MFPLLAALCLFASGPPATAQESAHRGGRESASAEPLEAGRLIEKQIHDDASHRYLLPMNSGDYARVVLDQMGIDVVVSLVGPGDQRLLEMDSPTGNFGIEQLSWVAQVTSTYVLEVRAVDGRSGEGCYSVRLEELRAAAANDRKSLLAELALSRGYQARDHPADQAKAILELREAASIWRDLGDLYQEGLALHTLGELLAASGHFQEAVNEYTEALLARQGAMDRPGQAYTLFLRGTMEAWIGQTSEALADYNGALSIEQQLGDTRAEAEIRSNLGRLYDYVGDKSKALEEYDRALPLLRATRNRIAEARTVTRLALLYQTQGNKQKALNYGLDGLALARTLSDRQLEALVGAIVGRIYADLWAADAALRYLRDALKVVQELGDRPSEATILSDIGRVHGDQGETGEALEDYRRALPLLREIGDPRSEAGALISLGQVYMVRGDPVRALSSFEQARGIARGAADPYREADAMTNLGAAHFLLGKLEQAIEELQQARVIRRRVSDRLGEAAASYQMARIERKRGNLEMSRELAESVLEAVESVRGEVSTPELRASFLGSVQDYYQFSIDLLMRLFQTSGSGHYAELALQVSERGRARSLIDLLAEAAADVHEGVDTALLERERAVRRRLNERLQRQVLAGAPGALPNAAELNRDVESLNTELQQVQGEIRTRSPRYAALMQPRPRRLAEIQSLLGPETLLLEYSLGADHSFLWAVTENSLATYELPGRAVIETLSKKLTAELARPEGTPARRRELRRTSRKLGRILIEPVGAQLAGKRLLVTADGALEYLPFAVLEVAPRAGAPPRFLLAGHEILSLPSASVLAVQREQLAGRSAPHKSLLVLADPVFEREDTRVTKGPARTSTDRDLPSSAEPLSNVALGGARAVGGNEGSRLPRLAFSRREAAAILELVPPKDRRGAFDFDANLAAATSDDLSQYRYVHFATHGFLNSQHPQLSGLVFSLVDRDGKSQNGFLSTTEIFNLHLSADLVVLSACQTALGKEIRGEGLVGLTRAFMYAGAPRVVASLWRVDDAATAELMKRFYEGMLGPKKLRPVAALRQAQLAISKQRRWEHPYYWAGFILQGDWR